MATVYPTKSIKTKIVQNKNPQPKLRKMMVF